MVKSILLISRKCQWWNFAGGYDRSSIRKIIPHGCVLFNRKNQQTFTWIFVQAYSILWLFLVWWWFSHNILLLQLSVSCRVMRSIRQHNAGWVTCQKDATSYKKHCVCPSESEVDQKKNVILYHMIIQPLNDFPFFRNIYLLVVSTADDGLLLK